MSLGGSKSKGSTTSTSASESEDWGTNVWGAQSPYLADLYKRSQMAIGGGAGQNNIYQSYMGEANTADAMARRALQGQTGALNAAYQPITSSNQLLGNSNRELARADTSLASGFSTLGQSRAALAKFLNPGVDPALKAYSRDLGQQFKEQFLPGLKGDAAIAGGLGGSRQQIGAALGSQRAAQELSDFSAGLYNAGQERALAAAQGIGALNQGYIQNAGGYQQNAAGYQQGAQGYRDTAGLYGQIAQGFGQNAAGYQAGSANAQGKYDLARSMPWYNLNQYAGLLGMPAFQDLGGWTSSKTTSKGKQGSNSFNFGWGS